MKSNRRGAGGRGGRGGRGDAPSSSARSSNATRSSTLMSTCVAGGFPPTNVPPRGRAPVRSRRDVCRSVLTGTLSLLDPRGRAFDRALGRRTAVRSSGDMADIGALVTNAQTLCASDAGLAELQTILDANKDGLAARGDACLAALESGALRPDEHALAWIHLLCAVAGPAPPRDAPMHELDPAGEMDIAGIGSQGSDQPPSQSPAPSPARPPARSRDRATSTRRASNAHARCTSPGTTPGAPPATGSSRSRRPSARRARARTRRGIPPSLRASAPSSSPSPSSSEGPRRRSRRCSER